MQSAEPTKILQRVVSQRLVAMCKCVMCKCVMCKSETVGDLFISRAPNQSWIFNRSQCVTLLYMYNFIASCISYLLEYDNYGIWGWRDGSTNG